MTCIENTSEVDSFKSETENEFKEVTAEKIPVSTDSFQEKNLEDAPLLRTVQNASSNAKIIIDLKDLQIQLLNYKLNRLGR